VKGEGDPGPRYGQDRAEEERLVRGTGRVRGVSATISLGAWNASSVKRRGRWTGFVRGVIMRILPRGSGVFLVIFLKRLLPTLQLQSGPLQLEILTKSHTMITLHLLEPEPSHLPGKDLLFLPEEGPFHHPEKGPFHLPEKGLLYLLEREPSLFPGIYHLETMLETTLHLPDVGPSLLEITLLPVTESTFPLSGNDLHHLSETD